MTPPAPAWYEADNDDEDRYVVKVVPQSDLPPGVDVMIGDFAALNWDAKDETPHTGHPGADLSHDDGRDPLEPTNVYIRRLVTERNEARAQLRDHELANGGCVPLPAYRDLAAEVARVTSQLQHECPHEQMSHSGVDQTPLDDPNKVWQCDNCLKVLGKKPCFCGGEHHA